LTAQAATLAPHATFTSLPDAAWGMNYVDPARLAQIVVTFLGNPDPADAT
jgi:hypothetical protein